MDSIHRNLLLLFTMSLALLRFRNQQEKIILPRLTSDSLCIVDKSDFLSDLQQDKFVVFLDFDLKESRNDFLKWVELSKTIAEDLSMKTIFYIHLSDCNSKYVNFLRHISVTNNDHFVLIDNGKEFLAVNRLKHLRTFSALLNHNNESILNSKKNHSAAIQQKYLTTVKQVLEVELLFVDTWEDPVFK